MSFVMHHYILLGVWFLHVKSASGQTDEGFCKSCMNKEEMLKEPDSEEVAQSGLRASSQEHVSHFVQD